MQIAFDKNEYIMLCKSLESADRILRYEKTLDDLKLYELRESVTKALNIIEMDIRGY